MTAKDMGKWYIKRAYHNYMQAKRLFNRSNVECIIASYEAIEFSIKAICKLLDINFGHKHFVKATTISTLGKKIEEENIGNRKEILQMIPVMLSYTEELRNISRYGVDQKGFPSAAPDEIFRREYAESVLRDAETICNLLRRIEIRRRWIPSVKIGILNGFVTGSNEVKCTSHPFANPNVGFWKERIKKYDSEKSFVFREINAAEISEEFAIVLNPFGETYPEIDLKDKSIFFLIKEFVENGGVYINTAGFPFFYAWDVTVKQNNEQPICEKTIMVPKEIKVEGKLITIEAFQRYLDFTGTLLFKEFNAIPTPVSKPRILFQEQKDVNDFGDLVSKMGEINEFRAMPKSIDCIPLARAKDEISDEIYPICALKRGIGYLLLGGMNTQEEKEADLLVRAIIGFCNWMTNQLKIKS